MRRKLVPLLLVVAGALLALPSLAAAHAGIGVNPAGVVRKATLPGMPIQITDSMGNVITCQFAYTETWEPFIPKRVGFVAATVGGVATAEECVTVVGMPIEQVILQLGMDSPKRYQSFSGLLPRIDSLLFIVEQLRILIRYAAPPQGIGCLYQGNVGFDTGGGPNRIDRLITQRNVVPLILQLFGVLPCPLSISLTGTLFMNPPQNLILV
jgi:hypothetical protein